MTDLSDQLDEFTKAALEIRSERDALREQLDSIDVGASIDHLGEVALRIKDERDAFQARLEEQVNSLGDLLRERDEYRRDAMRYRWLRDAASLAQAKDIVNDTPYGMDTTIDSAMAAAGVQL